MDNKVITIRLCVPTDLPIKILDPVDQVHIMYGGTWNVEGVVTDVVTMRGFMSKDSV